MKLLGWTGGIGMGKSASASILRTAGVEVVDTDELAREVVMPGTPGLLEVREAFGAGILTPAAELDRRKLAGIVFSDPASRVKLEGILHPRIRAAWLARVDQWRTAGKSIGVVVIPLLFETAAQGSFNAVVCSACSQNTQKERLLARGWSTGEIEQRIAAQWPVERKMEWANFVVWTEGSMAVHAAQIRAVLRWCASEGTGG